MTLEVQQAGPRHDPQLYRTQSLSDHLPAARSLLTAGLSQTLHASSNPTNTSQAGLQHQEVLSRPEESQPRKSVHSAPAPTAAAAAALPHVEALEPAQQRQATIPEQGKHKRKRSNASRVQLAAAVLQQAAAAQPPAPSGRLHMSFGLCSAVLSLLPSYRAAVVLLPAL